MGDEAAQLSTEPFYVWAQTGPCILVVECSHLEFPLWARAGPGRTKGQLRGTRALWGQRPPPPPVWGLCAGGPGASGARAHGRTGRGCAHGSPAASVPSRLCPQGHPCCRISAPGTTLPTSGCPPLLSQRSRQPGCQANSKRGSATLSRGPVPPPHPGLGKLVEAAPGTLYTGANGAFVLLNWNIILQCYICE